MEVLSKGGNDYTLLLKYTYTVSGNIRYVDLNYYHIPTAGEQMVANAFDTARYAYHYDNDNRLISFKVEDGATVFLIGFLVFGPQMLIGMAAAELSHKEAAGTSTGFQGLFGYIGAAASGAPLGIIAEHFGWYGFFITISICSLLTVVFLIPLWSATKRPRLKGIDY